jgi:hypothetical protein
MTSRSAVRPSVFPASPFNVAPPPPPPVAPLAIDDRLTHDRHGLGRVIGFESDGMVLVDFGSQVRRVAYPNAKVTKL